MIGLLKSRFTSLLMTSGLLVWICLTAVNMSTSLSIRSCCSTLCRTQKTPTLSAPSLENHVKIYVFSNAQYKYKVKIVYTNIFVFCFNVIFVLIFHTLWPFPMIFYCVTWHPFYFDTEFLSQCMSDWTCFKALLFSNCDTL